MDYRISDFKACGDGLTNDTFAIQQAIDNCHAAGGGRVVIDGGKTYICSSLVLKSNVELYLEMGATIKASSNLADFNLFNLPIDYDETLSIPSYQKCDYNGRPFLYFIYAKGASNISITGFGKIDGNEEIFYGKQSKYQIDGRFYPRMPLLYLEDIKHLTIRDVTLTKSAFWTLHLVGCQDVLVDGIRILNNLLLTNCDGIDPDHCKDVRISNCYIQAADDGIVFKNTEGAKEYGPSYNISVTNCDIISTSAAIKFGTESCDDFKNIIVANCNIHNTNRGISIQLRDEGSIENCLFSNINIDNRCFSKIHWWGAGEPINITALKRFGDTKIGHIKNLVFQNINCYSENGICIYGEEDSLYNISDISLDNIYLHLTNKTKWPKNIHDFRPYYKYEMLEEAFNVCYIRYVKNINFTNFSYTIDENIKDEIGDIWSIKQSEGININ